MVSNTDKWFFKDFLVEYSVSGEAAREQITGIALGIYMDFELGYEAHQGRRLDFLSSFSVEDLPSDYLGFWAAVNGYSRAEIPFILEALGTVQPCCDVVLGTDVYTGPEGVIGITIARNRDFLPMQQFAYAPLDVSGSARVVWQNVPWPGWMNLTPIGSGDNTWTRLD